jgi:hypothetical protein
MIMTNKVPAFHPAAGPPGYMWKKERAFKVLHEEGVIFSVNGRGTFVRGS